MRPLAVYRGERRVLNRRRYIFSRRSDSAATPFLRVSYICKAMHSTNDTRESLILRLPSQSDALAWQEFTAIYEPMIYRFARKRGLQDADARELVQNVLVAVARAVERWQPDTEKGRFRSWLFRIARNQLINMVQQRRLDAACGGTDEWISIGQIDSPSNGHSQQLADYRRELFRIAAAHVRDCFHETTWEAFWRTSVLEEACETVAHELNISIGAVYIARSRVIHRLKQVIQQWERDDAL